MKQNLKARFGRNPATGASIKIPGQARGEEGHCHGGKAEVEEWQGQRLGFIHLNERTSVRFTDNSLLESAQLEKCDRPGTHLFQFLH